MSPVEEAAEIAEALRALCSAQDMLEQDEAEA